MAYPPPCEPQLVNEPTGQVLRVCVVGAAVVAAAVSHPTTTDDDVVAFAVHRDDAWHVAAAKDAAACVALVAWIVAAHDVAERPVVGVPRVVVVVAAAACEKPWQKNLFPWGDLVRQLEV